MPESSRRAPLRALLPVAGVAALLAPLLAAAPAHAADRVVLPFAKPAWATASADTGFVARDATVHFELVLDLQDEAGAEALATAVSTPGSAQYRQFVAPADWIARFAPTQDVYAGAVAQLTAAGLTVAADQPASREYVLGSGSASLVAQEFGTRLHTFRVDGALRTAAVVAPRVPAALARTAAAVSFGGTPVRSRFVTADAAATGTACSAYWNQHTVSFPKTYGVTRTSTPLCGYSPAALRQVDGLDAKHGVHETGAGVTVAVVDAFGAPGMAADLAGFSARNRLVAPSYRELVADRSAWAQGDGCRAADWQPEQALDLEAAHAVAPGAALLYVGAADCGYGVDLALSRVLDGGLADVVSNSYGSDTEPDAPDVAVHQQLQAAAEGIGLDYASGDSGDASGTTADGSTGVGFPASSPWATAVGGTAVALGRKGDRLFESAWGDDVDAGTIRGSRVRWAIALPGESIGGAGGGASRIFDRPAYQAGVVPWSLSHGTRTSTDVSALASPFTGFAIEYRPTGSTRWKRVIAGGTSLATPIVAAEIALAEQRAGHRLGLVNPVAYRAASTFRDVTTSSTRRFAALRHGSTLALLTLDRDTSLSARRGYDLPTGLGAITPATLTALAVG